MAATCPVMSQPGSAKLGLHLLDAGIGAFLVEMTARRAADAEPPSQRVIWDALDAGDDPTEDDGPGADDLDNRPDDPTTRR